MPWFTDDVIHQKYYPQNPWYKHYQDDIWGIPPHNDQSIFEQYTIGMFAAGLNWHASFIKYPHLTRVFYNWDFQKISRMTTKDVETMLDDKGLIRNRRKLQATIDNAKLVLRIERQYGSLDNYFWSLVNYKQERKDVTKLAELGTTNKLGDRIAKRMKKDGFKYAGPVSVWSFLNSIGIVSSRIDRKGIEKYPIDYITRPERQRPNTFDLTIDN